MHNRPFVPALCGMLLLIAGPGGAFARNSPAPAVNHAHSIVVLPSNPNVIYLGAHYHMYKSTNGGASWKMLLGQMMLSLAIDPNHPSTLYGISSTQGLLKSTDAGLHWHGSSSGLPRGVAIGVAFDPHGKSVLAYGTGIYRSTDAGAHWKNVLRGESIGNAAIGSDGTAYAAGGSGLFVSHDGTHWKLAGAVGNQPIVQVVAAGTWAYAVSPIALLRTKNAGRTWNTLGKAPQGIEYVGASAGNPAEIFAEVAGHNFSVSRNGGASWQSANRGIRDTNFSASSIQVAPSRPSVVYTASWGLHFYASHDGGKHWTRISTLTT